MTVAAMGRTRVGLIGVGSHMTENLLPALRTIPGVDITHVCARREENAARFAALYGVPRVVGSLDDMVGTTAVDAVIAAGPPQLHEATLLAALSVGKPVFVEKPPATSVHALENILLTHSGTAERTAVGYNFRFAEAMHTALVAVGGRRDLRAATIRLVAARPSEVLWNQRSVLESMLSAVSIHALELATFLFGEPDRIEAGSAIIDDVRLSLSVVARFPGDKVVSLQLGNYGNRMEFDVELVTTTGVAVCTNLTSVGCYRFDGPSKVVAHSVLSGLKGGYTRSGYSNLMSGFIEMVRGTAPSPAPLSESVPPMRMIEAILARSRGAS